MSRKAFAKEGEAKRGDDQRNAAGHHDPRRLADKTIALLQDAAPARRRRRNAHAEIGEASLERHDGGDVHAGDDEQGAHDIRQDDGRR